VTPAGASPGGIGLRLVDVPLTAQSDPRARLYIVDHLAPGTAVQRRVEVSSTAGSTTHVGLYAAAATLAKGTFLGAAGHTANDLSTWTSVSPDASDLPADGRVTAVVTLSVPRDATPGERYGVVWAEARSVERGGVTQVSRVGIRLYVSVGTGGLPAPGFAIDSLTAERSAAGRPTIVATVRNTGRRALDMTGTLRLSAGPGGLSAGPFPANLGTTLAVGDTEPVTIGLDPRLPAGPWNAEITLRSGLVEHVARATVTFPDTGAAAPVSTRPDRRGRVPAVAVLLLGAVAVLVTLQRKRLRARR
jgi:hypothetical protein